MTRAKVLVSACLLGRPVRYDGKAKSPANALLLSLSAQGRIVPFCPEVAAGLATPRPSAEIADGRSGFDVIAGVGRIIEADGRDVTDIYLAGASQALRQAQEQGCRFALLTDGSPSCGTHFVHDGSFSGQRQPGEGVAAALLRSHGIEVFPHTQVEALAARLAAADGLPNEPGDVATDRGAGTG